MRFIALDVHRDFCEVAIAEAGRVRRAGRVEPTPATLELFAQSLGGDDQVVLEATDNALAIARIYRGACGSRCARQPEGSQECDAIGAEDGQTRRAYADEAACGLLSARGVDARRTDTRPAQADLAP